MSGRKKRTQSQEINKRSTKKKRRDESEEEDEQEEEIENNNIQENGEEEELGDLEINHPKLKDNEFMRGSVKRIKLKDFVTYDDVEIFPGPRLNVVIGPNGSGKSTIVCALILGLGGKPNLLKKGKQLSEFIKHKKQMATIELELHVDNKRSIIIERKINKDNSSRWKIDKKFANSNEVEEKIKEMGIQVENLCQFLPQDRVGDFAKMQPKDILKETLRARDITLLDKHELLINFREETSKLLKTIEDQRSQVNDLEIQNRQRREMVDRYIERQKLVDKQNLLKKKRPYIQYEEARRVHREITEQIAVQKEKFVELLKKVEPQMEKIKEKEAELEKQVKNKEKLAKVLEKIDFERRKNVETIEKCEQAHNSLEAELERVKERAQKREEEIKKNRIEIDQLEQELRDDRSEELLVRKEEIFKKLEETKVLYSKNQKEHSLTQQKMHPIYSEVKRYKEELQNLKNIKSQKMERIRERDIETVYDWIQSNKDLFEKEVHGPVVLEVDVKNEMHANYLEQATPAWLRTAFVCQTSKDRETILKEFADKNKKKIVVILIESLNERYDHPASLEEVKEFGIEAYLDQVFEAPLPVRVALLENAGLHKMGVGTKATDRPGVTDQLIKDGRINYFFTPSSQFTVKTSRYGNKTTSTSRVPLRMAKLFSAGLDQAKKETLENKIKDSDEKLKLLNKEKQQLELEEVNIKKENNKLKEEGNEISKKMSQRDSLVSKINNRKARLEKMLKVNEEEDKEEELAIQNKINKVKETIFQTIFKLRDACKSLTDHAIKNDIVISKEIYLSKLVKNLTEKFDEDNQQMARAQEELRVLKERQLSSKENAVKLFRIAEKTIALTEEVKEMFAQLPDTLEELDEELEALNLSLSTMYEQDPSVIEEYERCQRQLQSVKDLLLKNETDFQRKTNNIEDIKVSWVSEVKKIVKLLNTQFSRFMSHIKCTGEVRLAMDPPEEFSSYGIEIRVKFRDNTNLQTLNAQLQSGGEKSVATMLFLLSLQSIVSFPFRLVDEINQGMDPVNERMIFSQVVDISTSPGPQYFLITPKLLLDLPFQKGMTVLCVYNGPWTISNDVFLQYTF